MKKITILVTLSLFGLVILSGCATNSTGQGTSRNGIITLISTAIGGAAGAAVDKRNRWRGAAIGATAGALVGSTLEKLQEKAVIDAASSNRIITYKDDQGNIVQAIPNDWNQFTKCRKVTRRTYVRGNTRSPEDETIVEVCEGQRITKTY